MRGFKQVTLLVVCLSVAVAQAGLTNPGFETGSLAPWYNDRDFGVVEYWNVTSADAHSGAYSATNVGNGEIRQDFAAIPVSQITEVSYWLKQPEVAISAYTFFYSDSSYYQDLVYLSGADWQFFDVTSFLEAGKQLVAFSIFGYGGGGAAEDRTYLDDVTIETTGDVIPAPGAIVLTGLGAAVVSWLRRRRTL